MHLTEAWINQEMRDASVSLSRTKVLERIVEAIKALNEHRGSSTKEIIKYLLRSGPTPDRNLTLKVQQALKQAVRSDNLKLCSGRYKINATEQPKQMVHPIPTKSSSDAVTKSAQRITKDKRAHRINDGVKRTKRKIVYVDRIQKPSAAKLKKPKTIVKRNKLNVKNVKKTRNVTFANTTDILDDKKIASKKKPPKCSADKIIKNVEEKVKSKNKEKIDKGFKKINDKSIEVRKVKSKSMKSKDEKSIEKTKRKTYSTTTTTTTTAAANSSKDKRTK